MSRCFKSVLRWSCAVVLCLGAGISAAGEPSQFDFEVLLDARPIGTHRFTVRSDDAGRTEVTSQASFDVRLLGIVVYRYRHGATERWQGDCLAGMEASTDDDGNRVAVRGAQLATGRFELTAPRPQFRTGCLRSYAYWKPQVLLSAEELLNPQTGEFDAVRIESLGRERITVRGAQVEADRYRLRGAKLSIDLWYSASGEWLQLESPARGNRKLRYRLR
jgi:hypothetical protein